MPMLQVARVEVWDDTGLFNLITEDDVTQWTSIDTPTVTPGQTDPDGGTNAYLIADTSASALQSKYRPVGFTTDGAKLVVFVVKQAVMASAGNQLLGLYDATAAAYVVQADVTAWSGGKPTITMTQGTLLGSRSLGGGWWAVYCQSASVTATHDNRVEIVPASSAAATGSITVYRVNVFNSVETFETAFSRAIVSSGEQAGVRYLYVANAPYTSGASDVPPHTTFYNVLEGAPTFQQDMFDALRTSGRSRAGVGSVTLNNADQALDGWLDYYFAGRDCDFWQASYSTVPNSLAFPSDFDVLFSGVMNTPDADDTTLTLSFRDAQAKLEVPLQRNKYGGPTQGGTASINITSDLDGKPYPVAYGEVLNITPVLLDPVKLIYQVNDGAVASIQPYDGGVEIPLGSVVGFTLASTGDSFDAGVDMAAGAGVFVAAGSDTGSAFDGLMLSSDGGETWAQVHALSGVGCVTFADSLYMAGGADGAIATSADGSSWTDQDASAVFGVGDDIVGVDNSYGVNWVAVASTGVIGYSADGGVTWTAATGGSPSGLARRPLTMAGTTGLMGYILQANGQYYRSADNGETWAGPYANYFSGTNPANAVAGQLSHFIACADSGQVSITSLYFTSVQTVTTDNLEWCDFFANLGYVVGTSAQGLFLSSDGVAWLAISLPITSGSIYGAAYDGDVTVAISSSGEIAYSGAAATYTSIVDLIDDDLAPEPGGCGTMLLGGYFRLGSAPAGQVTADVVQGASIDARTAGYIIPQVCQRAGLVAGEWSATDMTALRDDVPLGFYAADEIDCATVLDRIMASRVGWWGADETGVIRAATITDPLGQTAAVSLTDRDMFRTSGGGASTLRKRRTGDGSGGVPVYRSIVNYARNWTVQQSGLFGAVTQARRDRLGRQYLTATDADDSTLNQHPLAVQLTRDSLLVNEVDAVSAVSTLQSLFGKEGVLYEFETDYDADIKIGTIITLTHPRYGLDSGLEMLVIHREVEPSATPPFMRIGAWRHAGTAFSAFGFPLVRSIMGLVI